MTDRFLPASETQNAPYFGFNPSDEELISYLKRKVQGRPLVLNAIEEVDVYKQEDLSHLLEQSRLKSKDQEGFFFTTLEKYVDNDGHRYWHQRGQDKEVKRRGDGEVIGKIKRLVFNTPNNQPTNWVIYEYHLVDNDGHGYKTDSYVLCKLSHNSRNISEKLQQESHSRSNNLFDLNELPREFEMDTHDACLLPCVLNKEAPLPLVQYERKRKRDSFGSYDDNSNQTHSSSGLYTFCCRNVVGE
ncbi:unnamed protein product [Eruca vesicaria subsp. sativa]|uniref:NAC domain-containing protein n=1 Tax=Eruca vesicaria subsp. sativa TaxID=29727 RepID=A0ABC8JCL1_ERUVS|nr:unnamed protein product [Eruca vesicaria subsp. sativa]